MFTDMLSSSILWLGYQRCGKVALSKSSSSTLLALDICLVCGGAVGAGRTLRRGRGGVESLDWGRSTILCLHQRRLMKPLRIICTKEIVHLSYHHQKICQVKVDMAETSRLKKEGPVEMWGFLPHPFNLLRPLIRYR